MSVALPRLSRLAQLCVSPVSSVAAASLVRNKTNQKKKKKGERERIPRRLVGTTTSQSKTRAHKRGCPRTVEPARQAHDNGERERLCCASWRRSICECSYAGVEAQQAQSPLQRTPSWTAGIISAAQVRWRFCSCARAPNGVAKPYLLLEKRSRAAKRCASRDNMGEALGPELWAKSTGCPLAGHAASKRRGCLHPRLVASSTHAVARKDRVACRWPAMPRTL